MRLKNNIIIPRMWNLRYVQQKFEMHITSSNAIIINIYLEC